MNKIILYAIFLVGLTISFATFADAAEDESKQEWISCQSNDECIIIDTEGCLGFKAINKRFEDEYRKWATLENMRTNCIYDAKYKQLNVNSFFTECKEGKCILELKP